MLKIITITIVATSFFYPTQASWFFILFFTSIEMYLLFISLINSKHYFVEGINLSDEEKLVLNKYYLYFRYPFASRSLSTSLSLIALVIIIFVPWLLYNNLWIQAVIIGLNYFLATTLSSKLNASFYLHDAVEKRGMEKFRNEMLLVDSIHVKLLKR